HVVSNLLGNAVKYVAAEHGEIAVSGGVENGGVRLSVRDNGIGIPPAYHRGIFELFGRVPGQEQEVDGRAVGGTGVGLAIVKRIVEAHRGRGARRGSTSVPRQALARAGPARDDRRVLEGARACRRASC